MILTQYRCGLAGFGEVLGDRSVRGGRHSKLSVSLCLRALTAAGEQLVIGQLVTSPARFESLDSRPILER